ncbi:MAG: 4-hydroxy-tetrahydrodipicolinate reductase [Bacteroidota bacterium]
MNIGLFGYGKMGKMIELLAKKRQHTIIAKVDLDTQYIDFSKMDVAIDFSTPTSALANIKRCFDHSVPIVSGTTGWLDDFEEAVSYCNKRNGAFIYASNFSLGVNIFFGLNAHLSKMMANLSQYNVSIEEIHHTQKLDAPSGTAITLAEAIVANSNYQGWKMENVEKDDISIISKRIGNTPGTHTVTYQSEVDSIELQHVAKNREGFALGAIVAAEWLLGKVGVFTMNDVLNITDT